MIVGCKSIVAIIPTILGVVAGEALLPLEIPHQAMAALLLSLGGEGGGEV